MYSFRYNKNSLETVENWVTKFNMICSKPFSVALFGALYFVGFVLGSVIILPLADIFGRKPVILLSTIISIPIYYVLLDSNEIIYIYIMLTIIGAVSIAKFSTGYIYMLELIPESSHLYYHCLVNISGILFSISIIPFFMYVSKGLSVFYIFMAASVLNMITIYIVPESPKYYYSQGMYEEAHEALRYIAKVNRAEPWETKFAIEDPQRNSDTLSKNDMHIGFVKALKNKTFLRNLLIMVLNWCACSLGYYIIGFFLNDFPGSSYINMFIMQVAELISFLTASVYIRYFGIKNGFSVANVLVVSFSLLYIITGSHVIIGYL